MPKSIFNPSRRGRRYSPAFKARLIEQCSQPGVVLTAVAQENGVSVPTLRRWLEEAGPLDASGDPAPDVAADMQQSPWLDRIWLSTEVLDMRSGADRMLAQIIEVFGSAQPHQAYCFANRRATRMKVLVHDGVGVWVALRRLNRGRFVWAAAGQRAHFQLDAEQFQALVLGIAWQRVGSQGTISVV